MPANQDQGDVGAPRGLAQPECLRKREPRGRLARIEDDEHEARTPREQIEGRHGGVPPAAAPYPEQTREHGAGARRAGGVERRVGVDERDGAPARSDLAQRGEEQTRAPRAERADDLRDLPPL